MSDIDVEAKLWMVMTRAHGGTVSLLRNLSLAEARRAYEALEDRRGPGMYSMNDSDIVERQVLGPDEWDGCLRAAAHEFEDGKCKHCEALYLLLSI